MFRGSTLLGLTARLVVIVPFAALLYAPSPALAASLTVLGNAQSFAVTGGAGVTNVPTDATSVIGNLGVSPSASVTGFPPDVGAAGTVSGTIYRDPDAAAISAALAVTKAITALGLLSSGGVLPVTALGAGTLGSGGTVSVTPGVYTFTSAVVGLHGTLTLDAGGSINPVFVFLIPHALTTEALSSVVMDPGALNGGRDAGVFWVTGEAATLGNNSAFEGNILAGSAITLNPGAQIVCGRAFAQAAVTFSGVSGSRNNLVDSRDCTGTAGVDSPPESSGFSGGLEFNSVTGKLELIPGGGPTAVPEPTTLLLWGTMALGLAAIGWRRQRRGA